MAPCWVPPLIMLAFTALVIFRDSPLTEALYFAAWSALAASCVKRRDSAFVFGPLFR